MLLKKVFTGKERISLQFDIKVLSVLEIPSSKTNNNCGGNIFVEWKKGRGSKDHGQTRHCLLKAKDVEFNDVISFGTHVVREPKSGACEPKPLVFSLKYSPTEDQKPKSLGEVTIDLGEFAKNPTYDDIRSYSFLRKKKEVRAMIELHIQAKWTKVDKKKYDPAAAAGSSAADSADVGEGNDTSESELTHLSDSDNATSEMDDEDTEENAQAIDGTKTSQQTPVKRKSSKRLSGEVSAAVPAVSTLPSITETESSPRKKGSDSDKDSDSSGKERSVARKSSSREHVSSKESSKDKEKEKEKRKKKPRPFSADFSGVLDKPAANSGGAPVADNKLARPLASHSSLGALALSPGGTGKVNPAGVPALAKKQRRRSLEPNSEAAAAIQAAIAAQNGPTASANSSDTASQASSSAASSTASAAAAAVAAPFDIPLHTEKKIQQEVEMAHEEVRSLRKELMAAQQKIRALEQDRQRLLQAASNLQMAQSTPPPELASLQDKCSKQDAQLKLQETTISSLRTELSRAKSAAVPWFQSRNNVPAIELPRIISRDDEKKLLMVLLLILSILSSCSFLFGTGSAAASVGESFEPTMDSSFSMT
eukprot:TRINITY_DN14089_c0_g1_i1.p1 TRINITY_DN14089_c0_g1~~TRINITY_DN14089_c0_g1_i1.p1  ORF type:complete len:594 (+),score=124.05 TRINITY_DN14089_c0_g1_i1:117-1898(+)